MTCASNPHFTGNPITIPVLGIQAQQIKATNVCSGGQVDVTFSFDPLGTGDSSIATASSYQVHGVGAGATTNFTSGDLVFGHERMYGEECPIHTWTLTGPVNVAQLACTSVTRGSSTTCTVTPPSVTVTAWQFQDSNNNTVTRSQNVGSFTWSGTMVTSGTVSATISGLAAPVAASITVTNRTNFAFTAQSPSQVFANSLTCYPGGPGDQHVLPSPPSPGSAEGFSCADLAYSFDFATISDNGPNHGYQYVTAASDSSGGLPTKFEYIVVSDLLSSTTFYNSQCGNYSNSNSSGFIAGLQLKENVFDHEQGSILSHWSEYRDAQNNVANNIGAVLEAAVGPPGGSDQSFAKTPGDAALSRIATAVTAEPCGGIVTKDSSQSCASCGAINFSPYQSCSGQSVPYCH